MNEMDRYAKGKKILYTSKRKPILIPLIETIVSLIIAILASLGMWWVIQRIFG
jgi:hypothetical protein